MANIEIVNIEPLWRDDKNAIQQTDASIWQALQTTGALGISHYPGFDAVDRWAKIGSAIHDAPRDVCSVLIADEKEVCQLCRIKNIDWLFATQSGSSINYSYSLLRAIRRTRYINSKRNDSS